MTISFLIFPIFYRLKRHKERQHPKSVEYKCKKCDFKTSNKQDMSCHKRFMHVKEKPHKCSECDQSFSRKHYVAEHLLNEHNIVYRYQWSQNSILVQSIITVTSHYSKIQIFVQKFNFDKTPRFSRVFHPKFVWQFFSWNQRCQQLKSPKPQHFHEFFTQKMDNFHGESNLIFWTQMKISNSVINYD